MDMRRLILSLLAIFLLLIESTPAFAQMVVIVNARSGVAVMSRNEVINIFFGRYRQFFNGLEAKPVDLQDSHPDRARFYAGLVGKDLAEINAYWSRQLFSGRMTAPPRLNTPEEVVKWVASNPGGIGFVELPYADARVLVVFELKP
jgi:ABC-type phosphate transport system substrate-binding protein